MHEIKKCVHMDFNKSHGCTCSTDTDNMNKVESLRGYTNLPATDREIAEDEK